MRNRIMIALSLLLFGALNYGIYEKQQIIATGETLLLELAPVDPRSLMQGDFMRLRYAVERAAVEAPDAEEQKKRGHMVIRSDARRVAAFVRFHAGEELQPGERLIRFHKFYGRFHIVPDSFLFQEGHAAFYEDAKYGVFKFDPDDARLLVGLADETGKTIVVPEPGS